jgi:hypothetical protein
MLSDARARFHALRGADCFGAMLPYRDCVSARDVVHREYDTHRIRVVVGVTEIDSVSFEVLGFVLCVTLLNECSRSTGVMVLESKQSQCDTTR